MPPALAAPHGDETRELEHAKRLAQRRLRDPERERQLGLAREPVAAPQPGALDRLREVLDRGLKRPRRADRLDRERLLHSGHPLSLSSSAA